MSNSLTKNTKTIGSVKKAIEIIEELAKSEDGLGVTEISNKLNYGVSATYHLLNTLKQCNIIEQDKKTKKYRIGFALFRICGMAKRHNALASLAQPYLDELREMVGETTNLIVLDGTEVIYIAQSESTKLLKLFTQLGAKVPFYCTGGGKAILAFQPKKIQDMVISNTNFIKYTANTISDAEQLMKELETVKEKGYAIDNEEREEGVTCIAAPVFDCYGEAIASISVSGPTYRLKEKDFSTIIRNVTDVAKRLSENLGYVEN